MECKISDVILESGSGATPSRKFPEYYGGNILWLKTKELNDGRIYDTEEKITDKGFENSSVKLFPINTVTIAMYGATVGKLGILKNEMTTNQACCNLVANPAKCDYRFLFYYLLNNRKAIVSLANGAAQHNINQQIVRDFPFPVIDLTVQQRIAGLISSFDLKIELNNKIIANLEAQAQAIFKSWFIDFEPFLDGEFIESELGLIPAGWEIYKLGEFFPVMTGKKNANIATENGTYPFFTCSKSVSYTDGYSFDANAILLAGNGDFNVKRYSGKFEAYQRTYVLIPIVEASVGLLYNLIKYHLPQIVAGHKGSVINYITKGMIEDYMIALPENLFELGVLELFNCYEEKILTLKKENVVLAQIRDTLLPKLMSGEIDVSNITIEPEEIDHV